MDNLLIDPKTGKEYKNVPPTAAADYLGIPLTRLYELLRQGRVPFGAAVESERGKWGYCIPATRLKAWANAVDLGGDWDV